MVLRRAVFLAMFPAAVAAPVAALIVRSVLSGARPADFLASLTLALAGFLVLAAISGIIAARTSVRAARAVSWADVGLLAALVAAIVLSGVFASWIAPLVAVLLAIATFWVVLWELVAETRNRFRGFVAGLDPRNSPSAPGAQQGDVYVIQPRERSTAK